MFYQHSGCPIIVFPEGDRLIYCACCRCPLSTCDKITSSQFVGISGAACLISTVYNVTRGIRKLKELRTGKHWISDIFCIMCAHNLGWFYEFCENNDQKSKEGKYLLEYAFINIIEN